MRISIQTNTKIIDSICNCAHSCFIPGVFAKMSAGNVVMLFCVINLVRHQQGDITNISEHIHVACCSIILSNLIKLPAMSTFLATVLELRHGSRNLHSRYGTAFSSSSARFNVDNSRQPRSLIERFQTGS